MTVTAKLRKAAFYVGLALLILVGWLLLMFAYLAIYNAFEDNAAPVSLPSLFIDVAAWDHGYVFAKGSLRNDSAKSDDEELILQTTDVTCVKATNTCTVAIADVLDGYLNLDSTNYDIASWTDRLITFDDETPTCVTQSFAIDRVAQTLTLTVRKKAKIPDYAAKSPLRLCQGIIDKNVSLADGFQVYWHKRQAFERRNGIYFHLLLVAANLTYFGGVYWIWRRRRSQIGARSAHSIS